MVPPSERVAPPKMSSCILPGVKVPPAEISVLVPPSQLPLILTRLEDPLTMKSPVEEIWLPAVRPTVEKPLSSSEETVRVPVAVSFRATWLPEDPVRVTELNPKALVVPATRAPLVI